MSPLVDMTTARATGPARTAHPVYVDLLPPCNNACPAGEDIQAWLGLAQAGKYREAWETWCATTRCRRCTAGSATILAKPPAIAASSTAPSASTRSSAFSAISPRRNWPLPITGKPSGKRVLVVGAGPSGLSAAYHLARLGHAVEIHEAAPIAGGMMHFGIPAYRLPREDLMHEIARSRPWE